MRYITKPWDIDSLRMELMNAMQFFLLRKERDQLLKEKMSTWQRMIEINRVRDLLVLSSGYTHLRNSSTAIASLLAQTRFSRTSNLATLEQLDTWQLLKDEIQELYVINQQLINNTFIDGATKFTPQKLSDILSKIEHDAEFSLNSNSEKIVSGNGELFEKLFSYLIALLTQLSNGQGNIVITLIDTADGVDIKVHSEFADWQSTTLMNCPAELLLSFLISYHHGGTIKVDAGTGFTLSIFLPDEPPAKALTVPDDELLDQVFEHYDLWQE